MRNSTRSADREAAHRMAAALRDKARRSTGRENMSREVAIAILRAEGRIALGLISVSSLGRWERGEI